MAGYSDFSKSNNAVFAEREGRFPLSRAAKLTKVPAELVKKYVSTGEWHHTSGWYNRVDYYSLREIKIVFGLEPTPTDEADDEFGREPKPEAAAALAAWKPAKIETDVQENCTVEWIEWSGSRNYPKATKRCEENCTVAVKSQTATITLPCGTVFTKRLSTRGFSFRKKP